MTNFKKLILISLSLFFLSFSFAVLADFTIENWLFYKIISLPENLTEEKNPIAIKLDEEVFNSAQPNFSDLRIIEGENKEIPFKIVKKGGGIKTEEDVVRQGEIINPSSIHSPFQEKSFGPGKMLDGNYATYFQNDYLSEPKEANFTVDLKRKTLTNKIVILSTDAENTWTTIKIEGSDNLSNWQIIAEKTFSPFLPRRAIIYPESFYRYLRLSFEHTGSLKIHELEVYTPIYTSPEVYLIFVGEKVKNYKLSYGNDLTISPAYKIELSLENSFLGSLSAEYINPRGKADYDKDGIANEKDNCPFASNSNQRDTDGDGRGDACDNCPTLKNANQLDNNNNKIGDICEDDDEDGVFNIIDNCPNYPNKEQKDENRNGIGDACDDFDNDGIINDKDNCVNNYNPDQADQDKDKIGNACDPKDDRWTERMPYLLWITIAIVIGVIIFFAIRLLKKMKQI